MANPFKFLQEGRTETAKVTRPTRRETGITTVLVFLQVIRLLVTFILGIKA